MIDINSLIHDLLRRKRRIAVIWQTDDILEIRPDLTKEQAWEVLQHLQDSHDANYGICWHTLDAAAEWLFPQITEPTS
jgi:hypothetical protein